MRSPREVVQRFPKAEADKTARVKSAEASSQARQIEAAGEAASRQKLADAEAYRLEKVGRANSEQMAREGVLVTKHPLLIQKTMVDKLADKVQVIIAPPGTDGRFVAANLIGGGEVAQPAMPVRAARAERASGAANPSGATSARAGDAREQDGDGEVPQ